MSQESINDALNINIPSNREMNVPAKLGPYTIDKLIMEAKALILASHDTKTNKKIAIKCIPIADHNLNPTQVQIIQSVNDPRIVQVLDSFAYPQQNPRFFAIVMPRAVTDLLEYVNMNKIPEQLACNIMRDIVEALNILHSNNIWHRNIKLENILLKEETAHGVSIALSGFDFAVVNNTPTMTGPAVGSLNLVAPELLEYVEGHLRLNQNVTYSNKIDIWSIGVVMYALLSGSYPLDERLRIENQLGNDNIDYKPLTDNGVSAEAINLLEQLLNNDPSQRPSAQQALSHQWFQKFPAPAKKDGDDADILDALDQ